VARVRRVPLGLQPLCEHGSCDTGVVWHLPVVPLLLALGCHGELGLQLEHGVDHWREGAGAGTRESGAASMLAEDLAKVLLVKVGTKKACVRVGRLLHRGTH